MNGAFWFGAVVGWFLYYTNRYRKDVTISDVATLLGAVGGAAVTALFDKADGTGASLFLSYGAGLAFGFFAYFVSLVVLVLLSKGEFTLSYLIDGRRKDPAPGFGYAEGSQQPIRNMSLRSPSQTIIAARTLRPFPAVDHADLETQHAALADAIDGVAQAITSQYNDTADPAVRERLTDAIRQLDARRDKIDAAAIRSDLSAAVLQQAVAQLSTITQNIKSEAQTIKDATSALATAAKVVGFVTQAIGVLAMLA